MRDVLRAAAPSAFLMAAMHERDEGGFPLDVECADAFRCADFMSG